ncbi:MAG: hypothetical protein ACD_8C00004G0003 [uncultured bacterium]|nr:MAG: hypothetical protein ACD_8C00004G0003 [uncultured bacterium]
MFLDIFEVKIDFILLMQYRFFPTLKHFSIFFRKSAHFILIRSGRANFCLSMQGYSANFSVTNQIEPINLLFFICPYMILWQALFVKAV